MVKKELREIVQVPENVDVKKEGNLIVIKGTKGSVERKFDNPKIKIEIKPRELILSSKEASKKEKSILFAYKSHLINAFKGTNELFVYKLKICSGHFPMTVSVANNELLIKNFIGEKVPRRIAIKPGVDVKVDSNIIIVEGCDKEKVGQVAADIEQATRRPGFDKRIFQDGIYIIDKAGREL